MSIRKEKTFTTFDIAKMLDVYPSTVAKWIDSGKLEAFITPGGHRRVRLEELLLFLKKHRIPAPARLKGVSKKKVLVIDDDKNILNLFENIFKKKFKEIDFFRAENAFTAGIILNKEKPDLVFLDIKLPGIDGYEVLNRIRENKELKNTKIVIITGFTSKEEAIKKGASFYLPKPFSLKEVEKITKKFLFMRGGDD